MYFLGSRGRLTCSGVTGFCEVLCNSSIVFWSYRRSFLHPTRMIGRPWQKCSTSDIHCTKHRISLPFSSVAMRPRCSSIFFVDGSIVPSPARYPGNRASQRQSRWGWHGCRDMKADGDGRNLLVPPYPIRLIRHVSHRPRHRQHSFQKRWERRPMAKESASEVRGKWPEGSSYVYAQRVRASVGARVTQSEGQEKCWPLGRYPWRRHWWRKSKSATGITRQHQTLCSWLR